MEIEIKKVVSELEKTASRMSQHELMEALAQTSRSAKKRFLQKEKSSQTEIKSGLVSRSKGTTLVSRSWNATEAFNKDIEHIKILLKYIF